MARPAALAALPNEPRKPRRTTKRPETPRELQGVVEGVPVANRVECMGDTYRIADKVGLMPLMRFAHAAQQGGDAEDMEGLAAIYDMLRDCIDPADWPRFERDATIKKAEADELLRVVSQTIEILTARPTRRPADSSSGPPLTSASSTDSSPSADSQDGVREEFIRIEDLVRRAEVG